MTRTICLSLLLAGLTPALAMAQTAPTACAPREMIVERLADRYGEARWGGGLQNATQMLEVYAAASTGSWTILITRADGLSCIVATGSNWFVAAAPPPAGEVN